MTPSIPQLPDSAPFTAEQRAYLNGFFAGVFSRAPLAPPTPAKTLEPLSILFGSQTGNCEGLAKRIAREVGKRGFAPTVYDLANYPAAQLASESRLLIVTSTYGDGEPPDNARAFWDFLMSPGAPRLSQIQFSVCALGDTNYAKFCCFGQELDQRLETLGGKRIHPRADCDVEYENAFLQWLDGVTREFSGGRTTVPERQVQITTDVVQAKTVYDRKNPFPASLLTNRKLNGTGSSKDTRHFEFALDGSGLNYEAGDALGVRPINCPELVDELVATFGCSGDESVPDRNGAATSLRDALLQDYEITRIPPALLQAMAERTGDGLLKSLTAPGVNGELTKFLWGREVIDLLLDHPSAKFSPEEFVRLLRKLQPRLYSISSSPMAHPGQVHLTVGVVRYTSLGRPCKGVCSSFLAERVDASSRVPVFVHRNNAFRPPGNGETPLIMIGPGTGIAPFRAFLEERQATGATGKNWLFFGDQTSASDFLYREEIEAFQKSGVLSRLDLAWSRDQAEKIYVQQRMIEQAREFFAWLESGASLYVCGDASRMAKDVDAALRQVIQVASNGTAEQAAAYVAQLQAAKRYLRDVY